MDLGPEGVDKGGEIVVMGTPEEVAEHPTESHGQAAQAGAGAAPS